MPAETLALARELVRRPSVTPDDAGCQIMLAERLARLGFKAEHLAYGDVSNCWLRIGTSAPLLVFAGHTDVVPPGPEASWRAPPFEPVVADGCLYGRGAADMKGGIAAFVTALERRFAVGSTPHGSIALLLTSDEEGPAIDGTRRVMEHLSASGVQIDYCLLGEPSSSATLADTVRIGRRGSLTGELRIHGKQGHVAYPQLADNPIHRLGPALAALTAEHWDDGNDSFPPTSLQVCNIAAGTGASNVIPGHADVQFNFRYSSAVTADTLKQRVHAILDTFAINYQLDWGHAGAPYMTRQGELTTATRAAIREHIGTEPALDTGGGTSDGRYIAPSGAQVIELGPLNASIHQANEHVDVEDLETLSAIYEGLIRRLLGDPVATSL